MKASYETRWFFEGRPETRDVDAFLLAGSWSGVRRESAAFPDEWREDRYVCLGHGTNEPNLGIKLRDERVIGGSILLEFKGLVKDDGDSRFDQATGRCEHWSKWSYRNEEVEGSMWSSFEQNPASVLVEKKRILRKVELVPGGPVREVDAKERVGRGMGMELTWVRVGEEHFWTLGFEAFPVDPSTAADFGEAIRQFMSSYSGAGECTSLRSLSYPKWIAARSS